MSFGQRFVQMAKQIPADCLPFADVASVGLPLPRLLRLSLPRSCARSISRSLS